VLDWIAAADVELVSLDDGLEAMTAIMEKYSDLPCDFADASLVYAATKANVRDLWPLDRDFAVFTLPNRARFTVIPGGK
jgi:predicted nucleic acid-binding protein